MRVIGGKARGIRLTPPADKRVRPTLDRVREAVFNILGERVVGCRFLDLFAGTGANGIEALSRGAAAATFIDADPRSLSLIECNLERAGMSSQARRRRLRLPARAGQLKAEGQGYNLVYADPPYAFDAFDALLKWIGEDGFLAEGGTVVVEHSREQALPEEAGGLTRYRTAHYGRVSVSFFS